MIGNLVLGVRGTIDIRNDQEIFNWKVETKPSGYFTIGYKWDWK